jgi:hypothetical protein
MVAIHRQNDVVSNHQVEKDTEKRASHLKR